MMSDTVRTELEQAFADEGIAAHIDIGQFGGGGQIIPGDFTVSWGYLQDNIEPSSSYFDGERRGIFHHMIYVHDLTHPDHGRVCGIAESGGDLQDGRTDFSAVAHGEITDGIWDTPTCGDSSNANPQRNLRIVTMQEWGHNDFDEVEPSADWCANDNRGHDDKASYSMATPYCGGWFDWDYHANRWTEFMQWVDDEEGCDQFNVDDPMACPSPGDLNYGVR